MTIEIWLAVLAGLGTVVSVLLFAVLKYIVSMQDRHGLDLTNHHSRLSVVEDRLSIPRKA